MQHSEEDNLSRRAVVIVLLAFAFATVDVVNLFPPQPGAELSQSPNESSRFDLVVSMGERHTFAIERELSVFGSHEDRADFGGHSYSNKAPGLSFAALPFYLLFRVVLGPANRTNMQTMLYLLRLSTVSVAVVIALLLFGRRLGKISPSGRGAALVLFAVAFGTPILVYARSFFSHAWSAALLYVAFELLFPEHERWWHAPLAGLFAGWAVLSEFPAFVIVAVLLLHASWRNLRRGAAFALGGLPPAILLGVYNAVCFGSIWKLSYGYEWYRAHTNLSRHFFGFLAPDPSIAYRYLFSQSRGILFESPILLLLPVVLARPAARSRAVVISASAVVLFFVLMTGYENWHGGWALGSRYLVPAVLLAYWPLAMLENRRSDGRAKALAWLAAVGAVYSSLLFFVSGSTFWFLPYEPDFGIRFYTGFWLSRGWVVPSLLGSRWGALVFPAALTLIAAAAAIWPLFRDGGRVLLAFSGGALLFGLLFIGPPPAGTFEERLTRARVFESFTPLDPGRWELWKLTAEAQSPEDFRGLRRALDHYSTAP